MTSRILMVASSFPHHDGSAEGAFLLPVLHALQAHGADVEVLVPQHPDSASTVDGVRMHHFHNPPGHPLFGGTGAALRLAQSPGAWWGVPQSMASLTAQVMRLSSRFDAVFAHWLVPAGLACLAVPVPLRLYAHGSDVRLLQRLPGGGLLCRALAQRAGTIMVPSRSLALEVDALCNAPVAREFPLPVDAQAPQPAGWPRMDVGFMGRLVEGKGVMDLAHACATAGLTLLVAGDGPLKDILRTLPNVTLAGLVAPQSRPSFMASISTLCIPSRMPEGSPAVLAEAFAAGVPVVGTRVPGVQEALPEDATATVGDVAALVVLLRRVVQDAEFRLALFDHGRAWVAPRLNGEAARAMAAHVLGHTS